MTHPKLTKDEKKVKTLLLSGRSRTAVSKQTGMTRPKVDRIVNRLVHYGEIKPVPGTKNPVIYEDPYNVIPFPPTGGTPLENDNTTTVSKSTAPPSSSPVPDVDLKTVNLTGISTDKVCPDGYVEAHIKGGIRFDIREVGRFDDTIRDPAGFTIGYWSDPKPIKGSIVYGGEIRVFNQSIKWQYREGNKGGRLFMLYPGRIFLDPKQFKSEDEAKDVFLDRANFIAALFARQGWKLVNPQFKGDFEYAIRDHPIIGQVRKGDIPSGSDISIDTSYGEPEAEMKHIDDWEKVQIFANFPSEILHDRRLIQSQGEKIAKLDAENRESRIRIAQMEATIDELLNVVQKELLVIDGLVTGSHKLTVVGSNLITAMQQTDALRLNDYSHIFSGIQTEAGDRDRKKNPLEGYN